jgi:hypothetical protein
MKVTTFERCLFTAFAGLLSIGVLAGPRLASKQQIGMFRNSKTCVVMEGGASFYNTPVKDAVTKYWKATEYEFIDQKEFEKRRTDSKYSFLVLMEGAFDKDPGGVSYSYMSLVLGDTTHDLTLMPELCSIPLSYTGDNDADYEYAIPAIVKFMQIHVKNLEKSRLPISINGLKFYNNRGLKDKTLLLNAEKMAQNANSAEKIKGAYPYKAKLLTVKQIEDELMSNPANTIFHFHVGPPKEAGAGKCFEMLFDTQGNLYYYNFRKVTNDNADGFNLNDFNNIK